MIKVQNLYRSFGRSVILKNLNFNVETGERLGIEGANGTGKTTLLRIISTLLLPTTGSVHTNGRCTVNEAKLARSNIGYVSPADTGFFPRLTGQQNLEVIAQFYGLTWQEANRQIEDLENFFPLAKSLKTPLFQCSSGMRQVLKISIALVHNPSILLLDEPSRSLDKTARRGLYNYLDKHCASKSVLVTSHHPEELNQLSTRILNLKGGQLF